LISNAICNYYKDQSVTCFRDEFIVDFGNHKKRTNALYDKMQSLLTLQEWYR